MTNENYHQPDQETLIRTYGSARKQYEAAAAANPEMVTFVVSYARDPVAMGTVVDKLSKEAESQFYNIYTSLLELREAESNLYG